jgi:Tfp pilus assembly protein PilO
VTGAKGWRIGGIAAAAVLLVVGWFLVVSPQRTAAADLRAQAVEAQGRNESLQARINLLRKQSADVPKKLADIKAYAASIPSTPGLPDFLREVQAVATKTGVTVDSVDTSLPTAVLAIVSTPPAPVPTSTSAVVAAPVAPPRPAPVPGLQQINVTISAGGSYAGLTTFVRSLEEITRVYLMTSISMDKDTAATDSKVANPLTLKITGSIFVSASASSAGGAPTPPTVATTSAASPAVKSTATTGATS